MIWILRPTTIRYLVRNPTCLCPVLSKDVQDCQVMSENVHFGPQMSRNVQNFNS